MNVLGINGRFSRPVREDASRHELDDGSAAIVSNGAVACAAIEERHAGRRYRGGFERSAPACLAATGLDWEDLGAIGFSSCCGPAWEDSADVVDELAATYGASIRGSVLAQLARRIVVVDHHESHAMLAFAGTTADRALVAVLDGMGNRRGGVQATPWWRGAFQRQSFYLATRSERGVSLEMVDEDCTGADEVGIGEVYRAVTHFAGWRSYHHAGKTMALAGYGDMGSMPEVRFLEMRAGKIAACMANLHSDPIAQVREVLARAGVTLEPGAETTSELPDRALCDLVAVLQRQVEAVICERIASLCDRYGVRHVCLGGGVALNCLAMGRLAAETPRVQVHLPPAPGDTGQALGNALWVTYNRRSPFRRRPDEGGRSLPLLRHASLGPRYAKDEFRRAVEGLRRLRGVQVRGPYSTPALATAVAEQLDRGVVVGVRHGRSEYGPRALGHTSILADPRRRDAPDLVNRFKQRERFRPYAPCVLSEHAGAYFAHAVQSPFMSFAGEVRSEQRDRVPAVVHVDGTARYQTVAPDGPPLLRATLNAFFRRTGIPVLLNTSFNRAGEPMVETPEDAARVFAGSALPALCLGPYLATKTLHPTGGTA